MLNKAIEERDQFLETKPHLKKYQERIDEVLNNTHPDKRLEVIMMMLCGKQTELLKHLTKLQTII